MISDLNEKQRKWLAGFFEGDSRIGVMVEFLDRLGKAFPD